MYGHIHTYINMHTYMHTYMYGHIHAYIYITILLGIFFLSLENRHKVIMIFNHSGSNYNLLHTIASSDSESID
jgi:hypothetical protein